MALWLMDSSGDLIAKSVQPFEADILNGMMDVLHSKYGGFLCMTWRFQYAPSAEALPTTRFWAPICLHQVLGCR